MKSFAVVTPTFNRETFLKRLYDSLVSQAFPYDDFSWIIIDDGSIDNTKPLIEKLKEYSPFEIVYLYKENGGKHTAWNYAINYLQNKEYKYFVSIDSDDELTSNALKVFFDNWEEIERKCIDVGIINARTVVFGHDSHIPSYFGDNPYIDETYLNIAVKAGDRGEMISSIRVSDLRHYMMSPDAFWLSEYCKFFPENVLWARASRKTRTRYLKDVLRIVHQDANNQVSANKSKKGTRHLYNYIVGIKYFYTENLDYVWPYQKQRLFIDIVKYGAMCLITGISIGRAYTEMENRTLKLLYVVSFPMSLLVVCAFYLKRSITK